MDFLRSQCVYGAQKMGAERGPQTNVIPRLNPAPGTFLPHSAEEPRCLHASGPIPAG